MHLFCVRRFVFLVCLATGLLHEPPKASAVGLTALLSPTNTWKYNDESIDLGNAWIAPAYNDSTWSNSLSAIGFRANSNGNYLLPPPNMLRSVYFSTNYTTNQGVITTNVLNVSFIRKNTPTNAAKNILTFYFRTHFTFSNDPGGMTLTASNLIDDGAVFYLNGRELTRVAMPPGPVAWDTTATRGDLIGTSRTPIGATHGYDVFSVPVDALVQGDNVAAVEVHQANSSSTAMAFQMELWADFPTPTFLAITNEPQDVTVVEGKPGLLRVGISGDGGRFQWYRQGSGPIPGAIAEAYLLANASTNDAGFYYAVVTNVVNSVTSRTAQVRIVIDVNGPALLDADGSLSKTNILVTFSESLLASTTTNPANYQVTNTLGGTIAVTRAVLTTATNVLLTTSTARATNQNYILIVNGVRDTSPRTNLVVTNSMIPISNLATLIDLGGGGWKFYDPYPPLDVPDLGTAWKNVEYTDTGAWGDGTGVFFDGPDPTVIPGPVNSSLSQTPTVTSYFRHVLPNLTIGAGNQKLFLTHIIDDGAIVYLNGSEIFRTNLPAGTVNYQTRASTTVGVPNRVGPIALNGSFLAGTNVVAVELHQVAPIDSDKVFGLQFDSYVRSVAIGPAIITGGPSDLTVNEGSSATFSVVQVGGSAFQWQMNSNNIADATSDSYTTTAVPLSLNGGKFRVTVNGATGPVTSTNATLTVLPDTNAPALVAAFASTNLIVVSFSEIMGAASAGNPANYFVTNGVGQTFTVASATLTNGTNVALSFAALPGGAYFVVVNNVRDASVAGNLIAPNSTVKAGFLAQVIGFAEVWRYQQNTNDLTSQGWTNRTYNDNGWTGSGPGLLDGKGGGRNPATLPSPVGTMLLAPTNGPGGAYLNTTYFRAHFNSYGAGAGTITFRTVLDDAGVIYLNGVELTRIRMPAGAVNYATQGAGASVGDATVEGPFTFAISNLLGGDNVIAVDVHQIGAGSSDVTWGGEFSVSTPSLLITNATVACTNIPFAAPKLTFQRVNGTNILFTWSNPVTNSCGSNALFTLQQSIALTNPVSATVWTNVTSVSPYTAAGTNKSRFFRLKL